jgi:hypothetical protein
MEFAPAYHSLVGFSLHRMLEGFPGCVSGVAECAIVWLLLEVFGGSRHAKGLLGLREIFRRPLNKVYKALFRLLKNLSIILA